jgi:hypothetical protein
VGGRPKSTASTCRLSNYYLSIDIVGEGIVYVGGADYLMTA